MKSLMINSTTPNILTAKMRDQMYLKHLRQVQKINNRQALNLKHSLKQYHQIVENYQKNRRRNKLFNDHQKDLILIKKNQKINQKVNNIRSMFDFNLKKNIPVTVNLQSDTDSTKVLPLKEPLSQRYQNNQENKLINEHNNQISKSIQKSLNQSPNAKRRLSLHYQYRKRQQQMIQLQNSKLVNAILTQKSSYSISLNKLKLPSVNTSRSMTVSQQQITQNQEQKVNQKNQNNIKRRKNQIKKSS